MLITKHYGGMLVVGLGLMLLMATTMLHASDRTINQSIIMQGADLYADIAVEAVGNEILNNRNVGVPTDKTLILWRSSDQNFNEVKFGAKRLFDSYVVYVTQPF